MFPGPEVLWARRAFLLLLSFNPKNPGDSFQGFKVTHNKGKRCHWHLLYWVWRLYFPSYPFLKGFLGLFTIQRDLRALVVLVVRLLSKFLAFLAESQGKRPLNQSRPFNLPGSRLALLSRGKEWGRVHMIILVSVSRKSKWMCWFSSAFFLAPGTLAAFLPSWWDSVSLQAFSKNLDPCFASTLFAWAALTLWANQNYTAQQTATFGGKHHSLVTRVTATVLRHQALQEPIFCCSVMALCY